MAFRLAQVPPPHSLHPDTLNSGRHGYAIRTDDGLDAVLYYCPQHRASGVYEPGPGYWTIRTPDTFAAFLSRLAARGVVIPDDDESREWIEACGLSPAAGASGVAH